MDYDAEIWRYLFLALAGLQMAYTFLILLVKPHAPCEKVQKPFTWYSKIADPMKQGWKLIREKPQFAHYQILFFFGRGRHHRHATDPADLF